jgi:hypothetical protein
LERFESEQVRTGSIILSGRESVTFQSKDWGSESRGFLELFTPLHGSGSTTSLLNGPFHSWN